MTESTAAAPEQHDIVGRHKRLVARTALISFLTLISRILGYVRESLMARIFGDASAVSDAFFTAWRIPNLFRRLMGEGALSTSLQNAITAADGDHGNAAGRRVFLDTIVLATWILVGISAIVMAGTWLVPDTLPFTNIQLLGPEPQFLREFTLRLTPFLIFACLAGLSAGALGVRGHFASSAWGPAVMNLIVIGTLAWLMIAYAGSGTIADAALDQVRQYEMASILAWGTLLSGVALCALQIPALRSHGLWPIRGERTQRDMRSAWHILKTSAPLALGAAVYQVNVMIDGLMAQNMLATGGSSALNYANRIQQFPLALVATAATAAVYPMLNALGHRRELKPLRLLHDRTQLAIAFVALPASAGLFVLAQPVVAVLLQHGEFGPEGTARTAACMRWLCVAILPAGAVGLVSRTYYALGDLKTPVRISMAMLGVNVVLNWSFVRLLGMDCDGLTLATAIANWANLLLLLPPLLARLPAIEGDPNVRRGLTRMTIASLLSAGAAWGAHQLAGGAPKSVLALGFGLSAGCAVYALSAHVLGIREWQHLLERLARRTKI